MGENHSNISSFMRFDPFISLISNSSSKLTLYSEFWIRFNEAAILASQYLSYIREDFKNSMQIDIRILNKPNEIYFIQYLWQHMHFQKDYLLMNSVKLQLIFCQDLQHFHILTAHPLWRLKILLMQLKKEAWAYVGFIQLNKLEFYNKQEFLNLMKDGGKPTIHIIQQTLSDKYISYELQITLGGQTYMYYSRFSELHSLFSQLPNLTYPFPRKHRLTSFVAPYISKQNARIFQKERLEELKRFFSEISKREGLENEEPFQNVLKRAKQWENQRMKQKAPKGKSLNDTLFGCGVKTSYILA